MTSFAGRVAELLARRDGHFRFESGHHGNVWLDLERLCLHPAAIEPLAVELAARLAPHLEHEPGGAVVCGPLVEGAFIALTVARHLALPFTYAEPVAASVAASVDKLNRDSGALFPVEYPIPAPLHDILRDTAVVVVNDVINAGSAVRGTLASLRALGARPVAIGALATLGAMPQALAASECLPLVTLSNFALEVYEPESCPSCAKGIPLDR